MKTHYQQKDLTDVTVSEIEASIDVIIRCGVTICAKFGVF